MSFAYGETHEGMVTGRETYENTMDQPGGSISSKSTQGQPINPSKMNKNGNAEKYIPREPVDFRRRSSSKSVSLYGPGHVDNTLGEASVLPWSEENIEGGL